MRVLVACECSGTVRNAFIARGHDAWSCDLKPAEDRTNRHIVGDATELLGDGWDLLMVAHPPCTRLCNSGVRWYTKPPRDKTLEQMWAELDEAAALFSTFWNAPIERIAVENPIMHRHAKERIAGYREFAQSVQPHDFGHREVKRTCLWLKNLPRLVPTTPWLKPPSDAAERETWQRVHRVSGWMAAADRQRERSRFFSGIADAMADQWGGDLVVRMAA
ncbi:MAG TPA: hypothetical protein VF605_11885 [Allosphingosinicella sp.]